MDSKLRDPLAVTLKINHKPQKSDKNDLESLQNSNNIEHQRRSSIGKDEPDNLSNEAILKNSLYFPKISNEEINSFENISDKVDQSALSIFICYLEKPESLQKESLILNLKLLEIGDYFKSTEFLKALIFQNIKPQIDKNCVFDYFNFWMKKMDKKNENYAIWLDLFNFSLNFIAEFLDELWDFQKANQQLIKLISSNPLILEVIIEKAMKIWVQVNYRSKISLK